MKPLVLIGPMGAGKSEVGRIISAEEDRLFLDTDRMVEQKAGRSITEIFRDQGEDAFRVMERHAVEDAVILKRAVIATGGGVVLDLSSTRLLKERGDVFYLNVTADVAADRLRNGSSRPLLEGKDVLEEISRIIAERHGLYLSAAHHVVNANGGPKEVADAIREMKAE